MDPRLKRRERRIWEIVSHSPLESLWNLQGVPLQVVAVTNLEGADLRTGSSVTRPSWDSIFFSRCFPTLLCARSILGLAARSAYQFYDKLLDYLAVVIPTAALGTVLSTFNETTAAATSGKVTFGLIAADLVGICGDISNPGHTERGVQD